MKIDLRGLEGKFTTNGRQVCAVCGYDFDDDDNSDTPLLLWRQGGLEMLTLCWACATVRMQNTPCN